MKLNETMLFGKVVELKNPLRARSGKEMTTLEQGTKFKLLAVSEKQGLAKISTEDGKEWIVNSNDYFKALYHGKSDEIGDGM